MLRCCYWLGAQHGADAGSSTLCSRFQEWNQFLTNLLCGSQLYLNVLGGDNRPTSSLEDVEKFSTSRLEVNDRESTKSPSEELVSPGE